MRYTPFRKKISIVILFLTVLMYSGFASATSVRFGGIRFDKPVKPMLELKKANVVSQSLDYSCGAAGLSTLFNFYLGDPITEAEILDQLQNLVPMEKVEERRGFSLLDLKTFAEARGYEATGYKMDLEYLRELKVPVLVPVKFRDYQHFVVVRGVVADRVFIADPSGGNMSMKLDKFNNMWLDGIALVVKGPNNEVPKEYALKLDEDDLMVTDYKMTRRMIEQSLFRTSLRPAEWK